MICVKGQASQADQLYLYPSARSPLVPRPYPPPPPVPLNPTPALPPLPPYMTHTCAHSSPMSRYPVWGSGWPPPSW